MVYVVCDNLFFVGGVFLNFFYFFGLVVFYLKFLMWKFYFLLVGNFLFFVVFEFYWMIVYY